MLHIRHSVWVHTRGCIGAVGCVSIQTMQRIQNLLYNKNILAKKYISIVRWGYRLYSRQGCNFGKRASPKANFYSASVYLRPAYIRFLKFFLSKIFAL